MHTRSVIQWGVGAVLSAVMMLFCPVIWAAESGQNNAITQQIAALEKASGGRLGVAWIDTANNTQFLYRGAERFPLCSTAKVMAVAAILKKSETKPELLNEKIMIYPTDLVNYNPVTQKHVNHTMRISELSAAALQYSDNAAMNIVTSQLGGTESVTAFARTLGDTTFRLDRTEPALNSAIPGDERDTTSPQAMAKSLQTLMLGNALGQSQRAQLITWMKGNTTGAQSIRAGVPAQWQVGDKTGGGDYGTTNDIAVIWPEHRPPYILVIYFTQPEKGAAPRKAILAAVAKILTGGK